MELRANVIVSMVSLLEKLKGFKINQIGIHTFPRTFGEGSSVGLRNIILTIKDMLILFLKVKFGSYFCPF